MAANTVYNDVRSEVDVIAVDVAVMDQALVFGRRGKETPTERSTDTRVAIGLARRIRDELALLREVCRRDLGLADT